jgi:hypothetical protein
LKGNLFFLSQRLDLEPIPGMTLRGQQDAGFQLQPTRGATSEAAAASARTRNSLSLNLHSYSRPFFPAKVIF